VREVDETVALKIERLRRRGSRDQRGRENQDPDLQDHGRFSDIDRGDLRYLIQWLAAGQQSLRVKFDRKYVNSVSELIVASLGAEVAPEAERVLRPMKNGLRTGLQRVLGSARQVGRTEASRGLRAPRAR
jgi:hypothetical protein